MSGSQAVWDSANNKFLLFPGSPSLSDENNAVTADVEPAVVGTIGLVLMGFACRESKSTAAVATFRIMHGNNVADGKVLVPVELNANESTGDWFGPEGIDARNGLTIDFIAGEFDVTLFYRIVSPN